ncbi:ABC transporter ATP-binding protein [Paracoccus sp. MBLB3053]|uniref:ABC transporter ATP-binding protein n=1 Tax=Paracoccus aurantius TaxID=3073814 RepID=A0ABU2HYI2_9RHOB|nr:ABC transporter ATP-binding protein [Paracoccus sp. MBLB3053]MDS9469354.1 ABC transporter ATP-binding protein [Paracoccus sp. MBLB3053]
MTNPILQVEGLRVGFSSRRGEVTALRDVSFSLAKGETLALVGESGSGKSVSSLAIMGLLPRNGRVSAGRISYTQGDGGTVELQSASVPAMRKIRGAEIAMIFQEPMSSLNPLFTVGDQIGEMLLLHEHVDGPTRRKRVLEMLELVEIPAAATRLDQYPHELSGGMRQRVMIALSLICRPRILIADEPTTALDVTVQAQILDLMRRLQAEMEMSILFITHDMGVVAAIADEVAVMYAGAIVETAPATSLFDAPSHPYTRGLLASIPRPHRPPGARLIPIPGAVPSLSAMPPGCAFAPRCALSDAVCARHVELHDILPRHRVACFHPHAAQLPNEARHA